MGLSLGVIISLSVLFEFTKNMDPQHSWGILSMLMVIFGLIMLFMIEEPPEGISQEPVLKRIKVLTKGSFRHSEGVSASCLAWFWPFFAAVRWSCLRYTSWAGYGHSMWRVDRSKTRIKCTASISTKELPDVSLHLSSWASWANLLTPFPRKFFCP